MHVKLVGCVEMGCVAVAFIDLVGGTQETECCFCFFHTFSSSKERPFHPVVPDAIPRHYYSGPQTAALATFQVDLLRVTGSGRYDLTLY